MTASKGVGVFAIGEQDDLDAEALFEQEINPTQCSFDPCGIAIIEDGDGCGEATDEAYLVDRQGGTRGGNYILNA